MLGISTTNLRVNGFRGGIDADAKIIYNRIIADSGVSNLSRLNYLVKGLKTIYGSLSNTPVCYDAHWIGYQPANGVGATAGQACAKLYSLTVAGDAVQATASQQPLLLAHNGAVTDNYWYGSGVSGNYVSTPNAAANQITGNIDVVAFVDYKNNSDIQVIFDKTIIGTSSGYTFYISASNFLGSEFVAFENKSSTVSIGASYVGWVRCTRTSSTGDIRYFISNDPLTTNPNSVTWTQLGTTVSGTSGASANPNTPVLVGQYGFGNLVFRGKIYRATIANSIGGTPVVDFNPASYNAATSQTQWTSATSEVWTINTGTATTGYKGVLVDRTIVQSDGVDDSLLSGTLSSRQYFTNYSAIKTYNSAAPDQTIMSGNTAVHVIYFNLSLHKIFNGANLVAFSTSLDTKLLTIDFNTTNSKIRKNASSDTVGDTGTLSSTACCLFSYSGSNFGNINLTTVIQANSINTDATKTAMYNFIKSLNNNAF